MLRTRPLMGWCVLMLSWWTTASTVLQRAFRWGWLAGWLERGSGGLDCMHLGRCPNGSTRRRQAVSPPPLCHRPPPPWSHSVPVVQ
jgi:hypothetical protein